MKVYTKTGDKGETSLIGDRRRKDDLRVEAYGTIDEANSFLQLLISKLPIELELNEVLTNISHELFDLSGDLAIVNDSSYKVNNDFIINLEKLIDKYTNELDDLKHFILPGGSELSSIAHIIRTIVRRGERRIVSLSSIEDINNEVLIYVNRLSDFFFVLARYINHLLNKKDAIYKRNL